MRRSPRALRVGREIAVHGVDGGLLENDCSVNNFAIVFETLTILSEVFARPACIPAGWGDTCAQ